MVYNGWKAVCLQTPAISSWDYHSLHTDLLLSNWFHDWSTTDPSIVYRGRAVRQCALRGGCSKLGDFVKQRRWIIHVMKSTGGQNQTDMAVRSCTMTIQAGWQLSATWHSGQSHWLFITSIFSIACGANVAWSGFPLVYRPLQHHIWQRHKAKFSSSTNADLALFQFSEIIWK